LLPGLKLALAAYEGSVPSSRGNSSSIFLSSTTAWTLPQPWTEIATSTAALETTERVFHERPHRPTLDFFVEPLEHVRAVELPLVFAGGAAVRQHVLSGLFEERGGLGKASAKAVGNSRVR
jgi:hypothetical protein